MFKKFDIIIMINRMLNQAKAVKHGKKIEMENLIDKIIHTTIIYSQSNFKFQS